MSLPGYAKYKRSDEQWLGTVPESWEVLAVSRVLAASITDGPHTTPEFVDEGVPFLSVDGIQDGELVFDGCRYVSVEDHAEFSTKAAPRRGDVLLAKAASVGKVARVKTDTEFSIWSPLALIRVDQSRCLPAFMEYSLKASWLQAQIETKSNSNTQLNIGMKDIPKLRMCAPSMDEQDAIVRFLDRETAKIDALIAEQETLLALLAEKRQATISHAVTRGLDPGVPMKDSGIAWLGEVPAHWEVSTLGKISSSRCDGPFGSGIKSDHYTQQGALVVRLQNIRAGAFNPGQPVFLDSDYFETALKGHEVVAGDLLIAGLGDDNNLLGRACVAPSDLGPALVKADCFRFRLLEDKALSSFAAMQLCASAAFDAGMLATGTTRSRMPLGVMASRKVALPPIDEQTDIVAFIAAVTGDYDALTGEAQRGVDLLKERRSALISAAVTGKIDVRSQVKAQAA